MPFPQARLETISRRFHETLFEGADGAVAREFLSRRGTPLAALRPHEIGFCPPDLLYPDAKRLRVGDHLWSMRGRVVITIRDHRGKILGFAGRRVESCEDAVAKSIKEQGLSEERTAFLVEMWRDRKWINERFEKSKMLFGLWDRRKVILQAGHAVLVEGQMDSIVCDVNGIKNTVAICGSAMNRYQMALLRRYAEGIVLCLDRDEGGAKAKAAIIEVARKMGVPFHSVEFPPGKDPEDVLNSEKCRKAFLWAVGEAGKRLNGGSIDIEDPSVLLAANIASSGDPYV
jgi:DNA primase